MLIQLWLGLVPFSSVSLDVLDFLITLVSGLVVDSLFDGLLLGLATSFFLSSGILDLLVVSVVELVDDSVSSEWTPRFLSR